MFEAALGISPSAGRNTSKQHGLWNTGTGAHDGRRKSLDRHKGIQVDTTHETGWRREGAWWTHHGQADIEAFRGEGQGHGRCK